MRLRYSISALMAITAYIALNVAALRSPADQVWNAVAFYLWTLLVLAAALIAAQGTSIRSVFARGMFFWAMVYFFVGWDYASSLPGLQLPNEYLADWLYERAKANGPKEDYTRQSLFELNARDNIGRLMLNNFTLAFGLLGGCLALWRYRRRVPGAKDGR